MQSATASQAISDSVAKTRLAISSLGRKKSGSKQHQLATEVLVDMYMMSKSVIFVGLVTSQLSRIAVGVGQVRGWFQHAVAMDHGNIESRDSEDHIPKTKFGDEEAGGVVMLSRCSRLRGPAVARGRMDIHKKHVPAYKRPLPLRTVGKRAIVRLARDKGESC